MTVVVPSDARQPDLPALVLDTGSLRLRSDLTAKETKQKAIEENFMNDYFYDAYSLKWYEISIFRFWLMSNCSKVEVVCIQYSML